MELSDSLERFKSFKLLKKISHWWYAALLNRSEHEIVINLILICISISGISYFKGDNDDNNNDDDIVTTNHVHFCT